MQASIQVGAWLLHGKGEDGSGHVGEGTCMVKQGGFGHLDHERLDWQYGSSLGLDVGF